MKRIVLLACCCFAPLTAAEPTPEASYQAGLAVGTAGAATQQVELITTVMPAIEDADLRRALMNQLGYAVRDGLEALDRARAANKAYPYIDPVAAGETWNRMRRKLDEAADQVDLELIDDPTLESFLEKTRTEWPAGRQASPRADRPPVCPSPATRAA